MDKNLTKNYIYDFLLWIFLIFFVIFIADLSQEYEIVKHILVILSLLFILYRIYNKSTPITSRFKEIIIWIACIIYLYKNSFTKNIYEKYFGLILFLNIFVMCIPAFYQNNFHLGVLLLLLSLLTPIYYGKYDENKFLMFNITFIIIIIILYIYGSNIRHSTLLVLITIIPMLIKYNQKSVLYRVVGLLLYLLLFTDNYKLFDSRNKYSTIFADQTKKISNHHLADLVFKNNDWRKSKIYPLTVIVGYILIYKTFIFMKKNNIKTFIT
tara:strand:- start:1868 stop:2671 length:804 start_codon:yes stop_codon:yes gene_type:complete